MMTSAALLNRDSATADEVQRIMGLPDDRWSEINVSFSTEEFATATVTFLLTGEQLVALAQLAVVELDDGRVVDPS